MKIKITLSILFTIFYFAITAQNVKVMSFNVQQPYGTNWDARKGTVVDIINSNQPDVIGTQEAHPYMIEYIKNNCAGYDYFGRGRECDANGEGSFILYKTSKFSIDHANSGNFWFKDNYWECGLGWDPQYKRICSYARLIETASGKGFYVFNSHFPTPNYAWARQKSAELLCQRVNERAISDPVVCTGDFNSIEGDAVTIYLKSGSSNPVKMNDTYRNVHPSGGGNTFGSVKYDYIYVPTSQNSQTISSEVIYSPVGSDHFPIWAVINLNNETPSTWTITIKGNNGRYVSSENGDSEMMCNRESAQGWEKFDVIDNPDGTFSLRGTNGKYVSSENGNSAMMCNRPEIGGWEKFTWVPLDGNAFAIKGSNGRYVCSENGSSGMMCNRLDRGGWETFYWETTTKSAPLVLNKTNDEELVKIFPNPVNTKLTVELTNADYDSDLKVYNLFGKEIIVQKANMIKNEIDVSELKNGIYLIQYNNITKRFIKN